MPRVLIIERRRSPRSGKKTFRQSIEFVPARSLPKRLAKLQESGGGAIIRRRFLAIKKEKTIDALFSLGNPVQPRPRYALLCDVYSDGAFLGDDAEVCERVARLGRP